MEWVVVVTELSLDTFAVELLSLSVAAFVVVRGVSDVDFAFEVDTKRLMRLASLLNVILPRRQWNVFGLMFLMILT